MFFAGCQTVDNFTGIGDLTLAQNVAKNFQDEYLKKPNAGFYFVSEDGRYSRYNHCLEGVGKCDFGRFEFSALKSCERASRQSCHLFAIGHEVVWRGNVNFGNGAPSRTAPIVDWSDARICERAVVWNSAPPKWALNAPLHQREAMDRGYSAAKCLALLTNDPDSGLKTPAIRVPPTAFTRRSWVPKVKDLSDLQLCKNAVGDTDPPAWDTHRIMVLHVAVAKDRGLTPEECAAMISRSIQ